MAVIVAIGIAADGSREVVDVDVGDSEDETFWRGFLVALKQRGRSGVRAALAWIAWGTKTSWWERFLDSSTPHS